MSTGHRRVNGPRLWEEGAAPGGLPSVADSCILATLSTRYLGRIQGRRPTLLAGTRSCLALRTNTWASWRRLLMASKEGHAVEYADKTLVCRGGGQECIFTAGEQEFYQQEGWVNEPGGVPACSA